MPKVSVIVPVYGVEKFIERCARSLFEQTFDDVEFIFVDDCTKDNSINVLRQVINDYHERKEHVRIIHHEVNKGLPQARKTGMLAAKGDYVINFDSDDWVDSNSVQSLYERAYLEDADIVIGDIVLTDGHNEHLEKGCINCEKKQLIRDLSAFRIMWTLCNKMFKRSLLIDMAYPVANNGEDMGLVIPLFIRAVKFSYEPMSLYYYYHHPHSMTHVGGEASVVNRFYMFKDNAEIVIDAFNEAGLSETFKTSIDAIKFRVKLHLLGLVHDREYYKIWKSTYPEINVRVFLNGEVKMIDKFKFLLTYLHLYPKKVDRI